MSHYAYRLLNVFTSGNDKLSGNPLCVFEDGRGLDEHTMQALALQFNLSETTFILPSDRATARVRIFTPTFEMPFAGHPTLGTAHVVRLLQYKGDRVTLEMQAGIIAVNAAANVWTLQAIAPTSRAVDTPRSQLAAMLGLQADDIGERSLWVNAGSEQLIIPLKTVAAVRRCRPNLELLQHYAHAQDDSALVYVWSERSDEQIEARFFFTKDAALLEDPATGSACANLGAWFIANQATLPLHRRIAQGAQCGRPSELNLNVSRNREIFVSGTVIELGHGAIEL